MLAWQVIGSAGSELRRGEASEGRPQQPTGRGKLTRVTLLVLYYVLPTVCVKLPAGTAAIIGLALLGGAYLAGAFPGDFGGLPRIQTESARALGLSRGGQRRAWLIRLESGFRRRAFGN